MKHSRSQSSLGAGRSAGKQPGPGRGVEPGEGRRGVGGGSRQAGGEQQQVIGGAAGAGHGGDLDGQSRRRVEAVEPVGGEVGEVSRDAQRPAAAGRRGAPDNHSLFVSGAHAAFVCGGEVHVRARDGTFSVVSLR